MSYTWVFGRGGTLKVRDSAGLALFCKPITEVRGITWDTFERGAWKKTSDCMMRPRDVELAIRKHLSNTKEG